MDIKREKKSGLRSRRFRTVLYAVVSLCVIALITLGVARLKPAAPTVERATLWIDTVKRGQMLRQVRGTGTLVPEDVRVIAAATQGRVERILVQPGTEVSAGTVLIELSNPELQQSSVDTEYQLRAAEADYRNLKVKLEIDRMNQQVVAAGVHFRKHPKQRTPYTALTRLAS